ncbi:tRNA (guanosine(46)-N7)-methyltransferase TrmB [Ketogulonicigenium vulgare]|uniref:tRNA (guanosine(46)-N7)-methyltransferase TrmB n=1 Tax=Ketogulonicigenium vulgare TaxID=92945 RepID=UPI00235940B4|nr:tRNA (guanosine(46)-N7)-methyltransferase TrmB [Ketogulonicigenium vulgare]
MSQRISKPRLHPDGSPWRNFYGRIRGKTLRPAQEARLSDLDPLSPGAVTYEENPQRLPLDLQARFGDRPIWLEIGFGGGEHLVHMAATHPDMAIIGAEPYVNGVAMLLRKIDLAGVSNLAVFPGDVRELFDVIPDGAIAKAFLNYPDPWHKARHHRRRFVTPDYLAPLHRVLAKGAEFRVATDIPDYVRQTLEEVPPAGFARVDHPMDQPWSDWISTRYEQKALREGRFPNYMTFIRDDA